MKIRGKIIILVLVMLGINLLSGLVFTVQYVRLQHEMHTLLQKNIFLSTNLLRLIFNQNEQHILLEKALEAGKQYTQGLTTASRFTEASADFRKSYQTVSQSLTIEKNLKNLEILEPDSAFTAQLMVLDQTLMEITSWHEANYKASEELLTMFMQKKTLPADSQKVQLIESELIVSQNLLYLYEEFEKFTHRSTQHLQEKENRLIQYSAGVLLISLLTGLGLAGWLYQGIQRSLLQAVGFARRITTGEKNIKIEVFPKDETGELLHALTTMSQSLQQADAQLKNANEELKAANEELVATNETLEEKVNERTTALAESNQRLRNNIREKQHLADELNTFLYRVSHDLQGPAASIRGLIHLFKLDFEEALAHGYLDKIAERLTHLEDVFQSLTYISQLENRYVAKTSVDFQEIWQEVLTDATLLEGFNKVSLHFRNAYPGRWTGDKTILTHILKALVSNAIVYRRDTLAGSYCIVEIFEEEGCLGMRITDNGLGMNPSVQSLLFRMFYRGNILSKGKGLDLYMVKKGVTVLGGSISLKSTEQEGTTFYLSFPSVAAITAETHASLAS